ncbi:MAG: restriction endonuclease [Oscillospiraceae bacterium]|nr:restriction endonuclease [Oscillospiraceae bacterium]
MTGIAVSVLCFLILSLVPKQHRCHKLPWLFALGLIAVGYAVFDVAFLHTGSAALAWNRICRIWTLYMVLDLVGRPLDALIGRLHLRRRERREAAARYRAEESRARYYASHGFDEIDGLDGAEFEKFCAYVLRKNGFENVEITRGSGDQGVDIIAWYGDEKYAIQCKRFQSRLSNTPVQEVHAGRTIYDCDRAAVMTNSYFTAGAIEAAQSCDVELWDRDDLCAMIDALSP